MPTKADAALLRLTPGASVFSVDSVAWDACTVPFQRYRALQRSDESRFYVGLR